MMLLKFILPTAVIGQFRTYCSETETNTKNFLPFGTPDWENPNTDTIDTAWNTDRDIHILESDDGYKQVYLGRRRNFGSSRTSYFCMSSNGPLYFSTCPEDSDWTPKAFDQSWTGVSAVWEDLRPSTDLAGPEGGNVYFRRVNSYKRTEENFRDIRQAQALFNTEDAISQLYVVTYHKMANSNSKLNCDAGATWQYVFTFPLNAQNPLIAVNYGQLDWSVESSVMGVNGLATAENFISNFNTVFDRPMNGLASTSINCKNGNECAVVNCQKNTGLFSV